ncbi:MAG: hypothetical protein ACREIC_05245, partial [Limisphaerales bacterium]
KVYMATFSNGLNVYGLFSSPRLSVIRSNNRIVLSWPANTSLNYVLQSSADLTPNSWADAPDTPVLTNGMYQVTPSSGSAAAFYRLMH